MYCKWIGDWIVNGCIYRSECIVIGPNEEPLEVESVQYRKTRNVKISQNDPNPLESGNYNEFHNIEYIEYTEYIKCIEYIEYMEYMEYMGYMEYREYREYTGYMESIL